jgi:hypothetical protein
MKKRKDLQRMSAAMMKVKSPLKKVDPPKASTTSVAKKDKPFSYDKDIFNKIADQEKEKKEFNRIKEDMISRGKWEERHEGKSSKQLISEQLN